MAARRSQWGAGEYGCRLSRMGRVQHAQLERSHLAQVDYYCVRSWHYNESLLYLHGCLCQERSCQAWSEPGLARIAHLERLRANAGRRRTACTTSKRARDRPDRRDSNEGPHPTVRERSHSRVAAQTKVRDTRLAKSQICGVKPLGG